MADKKRKLTLQWPFAPQQVALNNDTGLLKIIAMLAMICDHAGKMLFPQYPVMRIIGRLAFPIYAYCIAAGCVYTRNPLKYLRRIVLLCLISQPIYAVALNHASASMFAVSFAEKPLQAAVNFYIHCWGTPNILFTLALGIVVIWTIRERQLVFTAAMLMFCWLLRSKINYGMNGIILMLLFYLFCSRRWLSLPVVLAFMLSWALDGGKYSLFGIKFGIQMFAVCALPLIYVRTNTGIKLPKWLFYGFYPAHLVLIYVLDKFVF